MGPGRGLAGIRRGSAGHGSIGEAYVEGATPGARRLTVVNGAGATVGAGTVDGLGSLVVRNLTPGSGYRFEEGTGPGRGPTAPFRRSVNRASRRRASFYSSQHLHAGLNYVRMRDGILLAATVRLPPGKTLADGPFPTVIEYSGYAMAAPHSLIDALEGQAPSSDPLLPDTSTVVGSVIAPLLGFATVSVQMRGTGCSGGAFDLFGLPSDYDGYDVVQTVGAQPWVLHHKVGMVGISYSGISQFVVAGTDPPDLAAIAPLSPTDDLFSTGYPAGSTTTASPPAGSPQRVLGRPRRTRRRSAVGDGRDRHRRHDLPGQPDACIPRPRASTSWSSPSLARTPALFDQRSPVVWASHIKVPVFMVGALEDEQVGPQWPALIDALHAPRTEVYATMINGTHADSRGPDTISRWLQFLDIYVAGGGARPLPHARRPGPHPVLEPYRRGRLVTGPRRALHHGPFGDTGHGRLRGARPTGPGPLRQRRSRSRTRSPAARPMRPDSRPGRPPAPSPTAPWGRTARSDRHAAATTTASFRPNPAVRPADDLPASANAWAAQPPYHWTAGAGGQRRGLPDAGLLHRHPPSWGRPAST